MAARRKSIFETLNPSPPQGFFGNVGAGLSQSLGSLGTSSQQILPNLLLDDDADLADIGVATFLTALGGPIARRQQQEDQQRENLQRTLPALLPLLPSAQQSEAVQALTGDETLEVSPPAFETEAQQLAFETTNQLLSAANTSRARLELGSDLFRQLGQDPEMFREKILAAEGPQLQTEAEDLIFREFVEGGKSFDTISQSDKDFLTLLGYDTISPEDLRRIRTVGQAKQTKADFNIAQANEGLAFLRQITPEMKAEAGIPANASDADILRALAPQQAQRWIAAFDALGMSLEPGNELDILESFDTLMTLYMNAGDFGIDPSFIQPLLQEATNKLGTALGLRFDLDNPTPEDLRDPILLKTSYELDILQGNVPRPATKEELQRDLEETANMKFDGLEQHEAMVDELFSVVGAQLSQPMESRLSRTARMNSRVRGVTSRNTGRAGAALRQAGRAPAKAFDPMSRNDIMDIIREEAASEPTVAFDIIAAQVLTDLETGTELLSPMSRAQRRAFVEGNRFDARRVLDLGRRGPAQSTTASLPSLP